MSYSPKFADEFNEDFSKLDRSIQLIATKVISKLLENPKGKHLTGPLAGLQRARFLNYRIIYIVEENKKIVHFLKVKKRSQIYE